MGRYVQQCNLGQGIIKPRKQVALKCAISMEGRHLFRLPAACVGGGQHARQHGPEGFRDSHALRRGPPANHEQSVMISVRLPKASQHLLRVGDDAALLSSGSVARTLSEQHGLAD